MAPISKQACFTSLPAEWRGDLLPEIQTQIAASGRKLVVLDDDPTGTQTVHDITVLTEWSVDDLAAELANPEPCVYILTNSRSLPLPAAQTLNAEIGRNLMAASQQTGRLFAAVSRSDSTLRGHYPGETDALLAALGMQVDATLIIPFFLEGGRFTINDVHYVAEGENLIPAAETPFARDAAFGYRSSDLRQWVEEKTQGRIHATKVASITLDDLRRGGGPLGTAQVTEKLRALQNGAVCIVNAAGMRDMQVFVMGLLAAESQGKTFLYRSAASFVQVRAGIAPQPLLTRDSLHLPAGGGGLIIVGSYVPKTTGQLAELLATPGIVPHELRVAELLNQSTRQTEIDRVAASVEQSLLAGADTVVYTSRDLVTGANAGDSLAIGQRVSDGLVLLVRKLRTRPRYLLAKGGITSSDIATQGLAVKRARVLGQIIPGVPVWRLGTESRIPDLVYIVFPGNVGDNHALAQTTQNLR